MLTRNINRILVVLLCVNIFMIEASSLRKGPIAVATSDGNSSTVSNSVASGNSASSANGTGSGTTTSNSLSSDNAATQSSTTNNNSVLVNAGASGK